MSLSGLNSVCRVAAMILAGVLTVSGWAQNSAQTAPPASSTTSQSAPVQAPQPQQFHLENFDKPAGILSQSDCSVQASVSASAKSEQHCTN